ncbi:Uncharacterized conserved protein, DUF1697 family [Agromyces sp. CF514]|uniref:DUF1697 domain-containing protein n=1 Tax=Agromyces sp. CF514 TaxID=1881031 RepID=UPI0008E87708|nr:DUF1697 domain-containing protein [Agromyces sp. CF514]SFR76639.1 Uncharacterized conserved protein, DUF1697 family [Agromyces sp. CF514]
MTSYIALLRGVNVGGITVKSAELRTLFESLGFTAVRTVLASGNVAFEDPASSDGGPAAASVALKSRIEHALGERFGYEAWIVLITREELEGVVAAFPFDAEREGWHPYVLFGSDAADLADLLQAAADLDPADDVVQAGDGVLYWHNRRERGVDSAFAKLAAKARFKPTTTNRNLRTLDKLLA